MCMQKHMCRTGSREEKQSAVWKAQLWGDLIASSSCQTEEGISNDKIKPHGKSKITDKKGHCLLRFSEKCCRHPGGCLNTQSRPPSACEPAASHLTHPIPEATGTVKLSNHSFYQFLLPPSHFFSISESEVIGLLCEATSTRPFYAEEPCICCFQLFKSG